ncbi:MAG: DUF4943 domain-containing protein [Saprospiraceae bacterium]|nr:DUF4943 domain-containing protein [Saprospiraceae bacterium]
MKFSAKLFGILVVASIMSCDKDMEPEVYSLDVESYIELLKSNQFDSLSIPAFDPSDIPLLLEHRNGSEIVRRFPANPVSSYNPPEQNYRLGVLALWTIESIRVVSIKGQDLVERFPSQNPFLEIRNNPSEWILDHKSEAYQIIAQTYFNWWETNKHMDFDDFKNMDPLETTTYKWH